MDIQFGQQIQPFDTNITRFVLFLRYDKPSFDMLLKVGHILWNIKQQLIAT